jgi:hypothetical protein
MTQLRDLALHHGVNMQVWKRYGELLSRKVDYIRVLIRALA